VQPSKDPAEESSTSIVLLNRDLRIHDHPALDSAISRGRVVPLFVVDKQMFPSRCSANRAAFLVETLIDLRSSLRSIGGELYVRVGDPVEEAMRLANKSGASSIVVSEDATPLARRREDRLATACRDHRIRLKILPGATVVPPGVLHPAGGDHYRVFTPYWRQWMQFPRRTVRGAPKKLAGPPGLPVGRIPSVRSLNHGPQSPHRPRGGESIGRQRALKWLPRDLASYPEVHDDLAGDLTSKLSPYLHFGCLSANELVALAEGQQGGDDFVRQLCWRDFHHQVLSAFPKLSVREYRPGSNRKWRRDSAAIEAWKAGRTGIPVVDAGMRQLLREGWMHNRARLLVASYLTRDQGIDWRIGAQHFMDWLVDADVANNFGNWQWVAGTGNDTRPNRRFNLLRQARRFDPQGAYVQRYVNELADVPPRDIHQPTR
jgi:deoxyribodipyrimidine photo-lyase